MKILQVLTSFSLSAQVQVVDQEMSLPDVLINVAVWLPVPSAAKWFRSAVRSASVFALLTNTPLVVAELVVPLSQAGILTDEGGLTTSQGEETTDEGERKEHFVR
jgi:hypothetical protein